MDNNDDGIRMRTDETVLLGVTVKKGWVWIRSTQRVDLA
jgi:hypothetical protein